MTDAKHDDYMTADDLLSRARDERERLMALWSELSEAEMTALPGPQEDWSVKDMIAHIAWWQEAMVNWASAALRGEMIAHTQTVDEVNARVYAENRDMPLAAVLEAFEASFARVESLLERVTDDEINDPELCNINGAALKLYIGGNTFVHYADHIDELAAYVKRMRT